MNPPPEYLIALPILMICIFWCMEKKRQIAFLKNGLDFLSFIENKNWIKVRGLKRGFSLWNRSSPTGQVPPEIPMVHAEDVGMVPRRNSIVHII